jgi:hypothetical protein
VFTSPNLNGWAGSLFAAYATPAVLYALMLLTTLLTAATGVYYGIANWNILQLIFKGSDNGTESI